MNTDHKNSTERLAEALRRAKSCRQPLRNERQAAALLEFLAEDDHAWMLGRLLDLACHLVEQGRLVRRDDDQGFSAEFARQLEAARHNWRGDAWRKAHVAETILGGLRAELLPPVELAPYALPVDDRQPDAAGEAPRWLRRALGDGQDRAA